MSTNTEKQAVKLETGIAGFSVTIGNDGVWFHFDNGSGQKGGFNLGNYALEKGTIVGQSIGGWVNKIHDKYWKTDLEKYQAELNAAGIIWTRGGDDTNINIIANGKSRWFNANGSDVNGVAEFSGSDSVEMPRYKSHKELWALKIGGIQHLSNAQGSAGATIVPENADYAPFNVDENYMSRHKPHVGGYYVVYEDGYKSFSPAPAFERGNTLISGQVGTGVTAKPIEWEHDSKNSWSDSVYGVHIFYDPDDIPGEQYVAAWGEGDSSSFGNLEEAKEWCQLTLNTWISKIAVLPGS